jgi:hypothetical protein
MNLVPVLTFLTAVRSSRRIVRFGERRNKHETKPENSVLSWTHNQSASKQSQLNKEYNATMTERKRADPFSSSPSTEIPKMKGGGERLIDRSRDCRVIRNTFVSGTDDISADLVNKVSKKACEFFMTFRNPVTGLEYYYGQGGFIQGKVLAARTRPDDDWRHRVAFQEDLSYEATPVTAKHNLGSDGGETYLFTIAKCFDQVKELIELRDGGCAMTESIPVRPATATTREITWSADDISFGDTITDPSNVLTKASRLFEKIPNTFRLRQGHRIGALVYRTFEITHKDAKAPPNTDLDHIYGQKSWVCIYTGQVTEVSANGRTFCHDINTFKGCSGAIIFLLDRNQPDDVTAEFYGRAVGINVGGLDVDNNLGFLINEN